MSDETKEFYRQAVRTLFATKDEIELELSGEAEVARRDWAIEVEHMMAEGARLELMHDWGGKLVGATLRLAGVMHCVQNGPTGSIEAATLTAAIEIARYLIPHAEATLNSIPATEAVLHDDAHYVLRWILRHDRCEFTKRDAQQHGKRRFPKADDIEPALAELERRGYIRPLPVASNGRGRPPSPAYEVNPVVFAKEMPEIVSKTAEAKRNLPQKTIFENIENDFPAFENKVRVPKSPDNQAVEAPREAEAEAAEAADYAAKHELAGTS